MQIPDTVPRTIKNPATGAPMQLVEDQTSHVRESRFSDREFGNPEAGKRQIELLRQKEREEGYLYRDPTTGYEHRQKAEGSAAAAGAGDQGASRGGGADPAAGESVEAKRTRLQAELAALDSGR